MIFRNIRDILPDRQLFVNVINITDYDFLATKAPNRFIALETPPEHVCIDHKRFLYRLGENENSMGQS